jgi:hypothetical protein
LVLDTSLGHQCIDTEKLLAAWAAKGTVEEFPLEKGYIMLDIAGSLTLGAGNWPEVWYEMI